jgi:hypothetical protein
MADMVVETKELGDFEPHVGTAFSIVAEGMPALDLTLEEAKVLKASAQDRRPPFQLIFRREGEALPQGLYQFRHDAMGDLVIFIVPTGQNELGVEYCATFN